MISPACRAGGGTGKHAEVVRPQRPARPFTLKGHLVPYPVSAGERNQVAHRQLPANRMPISGRPASSSASSWRPHL